MPGACPNPALRHTGSHRGISAGAAAQPALTTLERPQPGRVKISGRRSGARLTCRALTRRAGPRFGHMPCYAEGLSLARKGLYLPKLVAGAGFEPLTRDLWVMSSPLTVSLAVHTIDY